MHPTAKEPALWKRIVKSMRDHESIGEYGFDAYISKLRLIKDTGTTLQIQYPADLPIAWVEVNYQQNIISAAARVLAAARQIEFINAESGHAENDRKDSAQISIPLASTIKAPKKPAARESSTSSTSFNTDFRFEHFIEGPSNSFAYAAAQAVVNSKDRLYNPLFIHGGPGLGKTHLLHAIGNAVVEQDNGKKVLYITSEDFTNAYIDAMSKKGDALSSFRKKYRNADILLIDDVQFLARKEKTQEEFFHTFNALLASGKQIILSSDCPASQITTMDERLTSRFEQGMTVSVTRPCLETRMAILRYKRAKWKSCEVNDEIVELLAQRITCSVRRLEAALIRVASYASLTHTELTVQTVLSHLSDLLRDEEKHDVTIDDIQKMVCELFDLSPEELKSSSRVAKIAHPRQIAMYLSRRYTELSLQNISTAFGKRDHGTVLHATRTIERKMEKDASLREVISTLTRSLD